MTDRIAATFAGTRADARAALVTFVTAGDGPTGDVLDALVDGGADVIELGLPFTDPMADGAAIQPSASRRRPPSAAATSITPA